MDPMLRIHDVPDPGAHNPWRSETITPLQGLFALNSPFISRQADAIAARLLAKPNQTKADQIQFLFAELLQRSPTPLELSALSSFVTGGETTVAAWSRCAQALLAGNEMLFVD
jgi:hypothetical protein